MCPRVCPEFARDSGTALTRCTTRPYPSGHRRQEAVNPRPLDVLPCADFLSSLNPVLGVSSPNLRKIGSFTSGRPWTAAAGVTKSGKPSVRGNWDSPRTALGGKPSGYQSTTLATRCREDKSSRTARTTDWLLAGGTSWGQVAGCRNEQARAGPTFDVQRLFGRRLEPRCNQGGKRKMNVRAFAKHAGASHLSCLESGH